MGRQLGHEVECQEILYYVHEEKKTQSIIPFEWAYIEKNKKMKIHTSDYKYLST